MLKKLLISFLTFSILSFFFLFFIFWKKDLKFAQGGTEANLSGFAWAENLAGKTSDSLQGWISFNSLNTPGSPNYGVNIDPNSGKFSGYAWSEAIGWISFNRSETGIPPQPPYNGSEDFIAKMDLKTGKITGWARACSAISGDPNSCTGPGNPNAGGWDGWIKLAGLSQDGRSYGLETQPPLPAPPGRTCSLKGFAWGSEAVGPISFSCQNQNTCSQSDYKVILSGPACNHAPVAKISCNPPDCLNYEGSPLTFINNSTDEDGLLDIAKSIWDIRNWGKGIEIGGDLECPGICNFTPTIGAGNYIVDLYVQDKKEAQSQASQSFTIKKEIEADFLCSIDNENWQDCQNLNPKPMVGNKIYLLDDPTKPKHSKPSEGATITSRIWKLNETIFSQDNNQNPSVTISKLDNTIELTVKDSALRSASKRYTIKLKPPLPKYREIPPF